MEVKTETERLRKYRCMMLELFLRSEILSARFVLLPGIVIFRALLNSKG